MEIDEERSKGTYAVTLVHHHLCQQGQSMALSMVTSSTD